MHSLTSGEAPIFPSTQQDLDLSGQILQQHRNYRLGQVLMEDLNQQQELHFSQLRVSLLCKVIRLGLARLHTR